MLIREMRKEFTVRQIFDMINEANEAKGKRGKNAKNNASDNKKALKDIESETNKMKGGKKDSKPVFGERQKDDEINDFNSSTMGFRFTTEPSDHWKKRVKELVINANGPSKSKEGFEGDCEGNKKIYDREAKKVKEIEKNRQMVKASGLKAREYPKDTFKSKTVFNEMKLVYDRTFVDDDEVLESIPEAYKFSGNKFIVEDASKNKYVIGCTDSIYEGFVNVNILKKVCSDNTLNEAMEKAQRLMGYNSETYQYGVSDYQLKENCDDVKYMLEQMRSLEPKSDSNNIFKV